MRERILFTSCLLILILLVSGSAPVVAAGKPPEIPSGLQGKAYKVVRAKLLAAGWNPDHRSARMEWEKVLQKRYP
jgi:hypothetical protein